ESGGPDPAPLGFTDIERSSGGESDRKVHRQFRDPLHNRVAKPDEFACDRLCVDRPGADALAAGEKRLQRRWNVPLAIVKAGPVARAAVIGVTELPRGLA